MMSPKVGDKVRITSPLAPFFLEEGFISLICSGTPIMFRVNFAPDKDCPYYMDEFEFVKPKGGHVLTKIFK